MIQPSLHPAPITASARPHGRMAFGLTRRALLLLGLGFLWLIPGYFFHSIAYAMLGWDAMVLLAALVDGLRLPRPATLTVSRRWLSAPALGASVEIELSVLQGDKIVLDC